MSHYQGKQHFGQHSKLLLVELQKRASKCLDSFNEQLCQDAEFEAFVDSFNTPACCVMKLLPLDNEKIEKMLLTLVDVYNVLKAAYMFECEQCFRVANLFAVECVDAFPSVALPIIKKIDLIFSSLACGGVCFDELLASNAITLPEYNKAKELLELLHITIQHVERVPALPLFALCKEASDISKFVDIARLLTETAGSYDGFHNDICFQMQQHLHMKKSKRATKFNNLKFFIAARFYKYPDDRCAATCLASAFLDEETAAKINNIQNLEDVLNI